MLRDLELPGLDVYSYNDSSIHMYISGKVYLSRSTTNGDIDRSHVISCGQNITCTITMKQQQPSF